jgi:hypothetical protein
MSAVADQTELETELEIMTKRDALFEQRDALNAEILKLQDQLSDLRDHNGSRRVKKLKAQASLSREDWQWLLMARGGAEIGGRPLYEYFNQILNTLYGMSQQGYNPVTKQADLCLRLDDKQPDIVARTCLGILNFVPLLTPNYDEDGDAVPVANAKYVQFDISERTHGEYGCYSLFVRSDFKHCFVSLISYHHRSTEANFESVEDAVAYILRRHGYN